LGSVSGEHATPHNFPELVAFRPLKRQPVWGPGSSVRHFVPSREAAGLTLGYSLDTLEDRLPSDLGA